MEYFNCNCIVILLLHMINLKNKLILENIIMGIL